MEALDGTIGRETEGAVVCCSVAAVGVVVGYWGGGWAGLLKEGVGVGEGVEEDCAVGEE